MPPDQPGAGPTQPGGGPSCAWAAGTTETRAAPKRDAAAGSIFTIDRPWVSGDATSVGRPAPAVRTRAANGGTEVAKRRIATVAVGHRGSHRPEAVCEEPAHAQPRGMVAQAQPQ